MPETVPFDPGSIAPAPYVQIPLPFDDPHVGLAVLFIVAALVLAAVALTTKK